MADTIAETPRNLKINKIYAFIEHCYGKRQPITVTPETLPTSTELENTENTISHKLIEKLQSWKSSAVLVALPNPINPDITIYRTRREIATEVELVLINTNARVEITNEEFLPGTGNPLILELDKTKPSAVTLVAKLPSNILKLNENLDKIIEQIIRSTYTVHNYIDLQEIPHT